jgi:hypothetical protein
MRSFTTTFAEQKAISNYGRMVCYSKKELEAMENAAKEEYGSENWELFCCSTTGALYLEVPRYGTLPWVKEENGGESSWDFEDYFQCTECHDYYNNNQEYRGMCPQCSQY